MRKLLLIATITFTIWTTACQKAATSANSDVKTNTTSTTASSPNAPRTYVDIPNEDIKNLNQGLTPSEPCHYLESFLKTKPTPYQEFKDGAFYCRNEFPMIGGSKFSYGGYGNKDYISVLKFAQNVGAKTSFDDETTMLGLLVGNIRDVLKKVSGQEFPKEASDALAFGRELKYVFNDGTAKPRAYQLNVFVNESKSSKTYFVMVYFE